MPGKLHHRAATSEDAHYFAAHMRAADRAECVGLIGEAGSVVQAVWAAIELSPGVRVYCDDHTPVFILGCAVGDRGMGQPWLLATDAAARFPVQMTKATKQAIQVWLAIWPSLLNYVDARSTANIAWLERLGFQVHEPIVLGAQGERFRPFTMGA